MNQICLQNFIFKKHPLYPTNENSVMYYIKLQYELRSTQTAMQHLQINAFGVFIILILRFTNVLNNSNNNKASNNNNEASKNNNNGYSRSTLYRPIRLSASSGGL